MTHLSHGLTSSPFIEPENLVDLLQSRAEQSPDRLAYRFIQDDETELVTISYGELDRQARAIATRLLASRASSERALLLYPPGLDFIAAFFGCLYAGVTAVPAYPPRLNRPVPRIQAIVADSQAAFALTTSTILTSIGQRFEHAPDLQRLRWMNTQEVEQDRGAEWREPGISPETLAFLQYTSGSTSKPKGVMLTHGNLMHNLKAIRAGFHIGTEASGAFWLPSYHDMGLIGGILEPMYVNAPSTLMSPGSFLQRPFRWLDTITRYRATITGAPNFAYDLCVDKVTLEQLKSLDLSSLELAFCGAEPIRPETLERFARKFEPCGFRSSAFYPCYGLAESTLLVAGGDGPAVPKVSHFDRKSLENDRAEPARTGDKGIQSIVGCGGPVMDMTIVIANPNTRLRVEPGAVGEIWVAGPSVARGYWDLSEETSHFFDAHLADTGEGPFLRTGDLGFIHESELFITGRLKDLIIIHGSNHYPQDIEQTVESSHAALQRGAAAAFSIQEGGIERLVIVCELARQHRQADVQEVGAFIRSAVAQQHDLQIHAIVLVRPLSIPKTSSGKIRRQACRSAFLEGKLEVVAEWRVNRRLGPIEPATEAGRRELIPHEGPDSAGIQTWLVSRIADLQGMDPADIDPRQPFTYYGLGSVQAVGLAGELEMFLQRSLAPTLAWDYPTIELLARHLASNSSQAEPDALMLKGGPSSRPVNEPIAVVGLSCRFPGAPNPDAFWDLLRHGVDAIREVPRDRWDADAFDTTDPARPGKVMSRWGGFIEDVDSFDAGFFGISPREASRMDPQQRILLEVAWGALERAGIPPGSLAGSRTGVFVGISSYDYSQLQFGDPERIDAYAGTGNAHSIAANRLSYLLDLRGPSMTIDTACSSSLVAVHLACQSLRSAESDVALAGGVNLILTPELTITFSQARMLSPVGRCKTFDAGADGYVRGEGCGVVVLKRMSDALRDRDPILALIRGSAVNQDGRTNGLTAPNGLAQQAVIREALANAQVTPDQIGYVEAHGTGTPLGDPIEMSALRAVLDGDAANRLLVGSVKTNIGHLEAAAGIAGLIKTVLALEKEALPPHLHLKEINPYLSIQDSRLEVGTYLRPWKRGPRHRFAGVSSFGFGGTNAHLVVSEAPVPETYPDPDGPERPHHLIALSARTEPALNELARRLRVELNAREDDLANIAFTANAGRSHQEHRIAICTDSVSELRDELDTLISGAESSKYFRGHFMPGTRSKIAFLFTGQGAQYAGMGQQLYHTQPLFRSVLDRCAAMLNPWLGRPLLDVLFGPKGSLLDETVFTQPALFALEYGLAEMWRSWGIDPSVVLGHSVGEYVAACVAGVFDLEDGLRLITERARLMGTLPHDGVMAAVFADAERVKQALKPHENTVSIAATNSPGNTVISGERAAVEAICTALARIGIKSKPLAVSHAFHSPLMDRILDEFESFARPIRFHAPRIPLISNVTGEILPADQPPDAGYWKRHIREEVKFAAGIRTLSAMGVNTFIEIGPAPVLLNMGQDCLPDAQAVWLPTLRHKQEDWPIVLSSLGKLYVLGADIDWKGFDEGYRRRKVSFPTYPFERQRYWFSPSGATRAVAQPEGHATSGSGEDPHPVLGQRLHAAVPIYETHVHPGDGSIRHKFEEIALAAAVEIFGDGEHGQPEIQLHHELKWNGGILKLQTILADPKDDRLKFSFYGQSSNTSNEWTLVASGTVQRFSAAPRNGSDRTSPAGAARVVIPDSSAEREEMIRATLQSEVARVLGMDRAAISFDQPLDTLGLDSLMAMDLKNSIETRFGARLSVAGFLQGPTIAGLASEIILRIEAGGRVPAAPMTRTEASSDESPLSYGQQALWFLQQLLPKRSSFNVAGAVRLVGDLDIPALRGAFQQLIARHESLRTTFHVVDGTPLQRVHLSIDNPFQVVDASMWSSADLRARLVREAHGAFDQEVGPLFRATLFVTKERSEHILLLSLDHIITDFWSMTVLTRELISAYQANRAGRQAEFPVLTSRYADYVRWQQQMLAGSAGEDLRRYWKTKLGTAPPLLDVPTDRPRPSVQTYRGDSRHVMMERNLYEQIKVIGQAQGATPFMALLAAFEVLLHRYSGQVEFLVGSVIAGREHAGLSSLIGYFINPIVLHADISGNPTFEELLQRTRRTVLEAFEHQDYPPALLARDLGLQRDPGRPPLFETMFILQKAQDAQVQALSPFALGMEGARMGLDGLSVESIGLGGEPAQFDLTMMMAETEEGLAAALQFNADLFDRETIDRMLAHFHRLLSSIVKAPQKPVSDHVLIGEAERHQLLVAWNETQTTFPEDLCIHEIFESQVLESPDAIAVQFEDSRLTYRDLNLQADRLARVLTDHGVGPGTLVGLHVKRSIEMLVGLLGVLKAGGAYLPLDPSFPTERLAFMVEDSGAPIILTHTNLSPEMPAGKAQFICIDDLENTNFNGTSGQERGSITPDDLAYVIYTSGSTGRPKGVQIHHRAVVNFLSSMRAQLDVNSGDTLLAVTTLSFDIAVLELLLPLIVGGRVLIAGPEVVRDGALLARMLNENDVTILQATPAGWRSLLEAGWQGKPNLMILCGGEALTVDLAETLLSRGSELWNLYGPTETTIWSTSYKVQSPLEPRRAVPIGTPIANTQIYILDEGMEPVPVGVMGYLFIGGRGVSRGYLNRPELTAERFISNPFNPESVIYKTGDLARYLPDGNIEFLGRSDQQVKVRGFRIETGEVEAALAAHPAVQQAVVIAWREHSSDAALVGYVVPPSGSHTAGPGELRDFLRTKLPEYMVPSLYIHIEALPLTPNGKVDRKALPAPFQGRPDLQTAYVAPRTPLERELTEICAQVLGLENENAGRVGVNDNFFDLGGHSLLGTRLVFLLREKYGLEPAALPLRALFEQPTVANLAARIESALRGEATREATSRRGDLIRGGQLSLEQLRAEAQLDSDINAGELVYNTVDEPRNVLLTGASGFVGAFLLHDLLKMTNATVHCIVRARDAEQAAARIKRNLQAYSIWKDSFNGRIDPVIGDLAQPRLGLREDEYARLSHGIEAIYHNGAMVNFVYPYQAHKASNVLGTEEVLRLASRQRLKPVHFVSTLSILYSGSPNDGRVFREDEDLDGIGAPFGGYAQSKWVAEKLVMEAGRRGIPFAIYRPGLVSGHSETGAWNTDNLISSMTRACILLGSVPDLDVLVNIVPVDFVSAAIVRLSRDPDNLGRVYHLDNPTPLHFSRLVNWLLSQGFSTRRLPFEDWRMELFRQITHLPSDGWEPYLPLIEEVNEEQVFMPNFDLANTLSALEGSGIECRPVDERLLSTYLEYFMPRGFLGMPGR